MSAQIGSKLAPGRRGGPKPKGNLNGPLVIDPNRLGQIMLNRDAVQALTLAQAKVQVTISAGGTTAILVSEDTGKQIGGIDDLGKLLSLRSYVTKEKKQTASSEAKEQAVLSAYRLATKLTETNKDLKIGTLDNSFVIATKPFITMCENVNSHIKSIKENFGTSDEWKDTLIAYCRETIVVLTDVVAKILCGEKEKGLLDALSLEHNLPSYVRNKLTTKSLAVQKDMDLSRIFFPADPSKGLGLTVKEWQKKGLIESMGFLMVNSEVIATIVREKELFLELVGMSAEQFSNKEDPRVQRVEKTRILVVPPFTDHKRVLTLLEKSNFRGFGLPATAMDQSKDRLANLCAVPLRAYAFSVRMAETIPDFYDRIFPPGTIKSPDEKLGNYAKQCLTALANGKKCTLSDIIRGETNPKALMAWIHRECKIIPGGTLSKMIESTLDIKDGKDTISVVDIGDKVTLFKPKVPIADIVTGPIGKGELVARDEFEKNHFSLKEKGSKKKQGAASSVLQDRAKTFLKTVRKEHSRALAESMESYFRGFYAEQIQLAAVRIAEARFDEIDEDVNSTDSSDTGSDSDDE